MPNIAALASEDGEEDDDEEEDEDEDEDFENDDEEDEEDFKNENFKSVNPGMTAGASIVSIILGCILLVVSYFYVKPNFGDNWFILSIFAILYICYFIYQMLYYNVAKKGNEKNIQQIFVPSQKQIASLSFIMLVWGCGLGWAVYMGTKNGIYSIIFGLVTMISIYLLMYKKKTIPRPKAAKSSDNKKLTKIQERMKYNASKSVIIYTLLFYISLPLCMYALYSKIMNDPTFDGRGKYLPDQNKIIEFLQNEQFKELMSSKLRYYVVLGLQVLSTFIISLFLIISTRRSFNIRNSLGYLLVLFVLSLILVFMYIWKRSGLNSNSTDLCELDFISPFSMNMKAKDIILLIFGQNPNIQLKELDFNSPDFLEQSQDSTSSNENFKVIQQKGGDIEAKEEVPGPTVENMETLLQTMMSSSNLSVNIKDNYKFVFDRLSSMGTFLIILFFIVFFILSIVLTRYLLKLNNRTISPITQWYAGMTSITSIIIFILACITAYTFRSFGKENDLIIQENALPTYLRNLNIQGLTPIQREDLINFYKKNKKNIINIQSFDNMIAQIADTKLIAIQQILRQQTPP